MEKGFICIFSCPLAPSGGFPMPIIQLLSCAAENGEDVQLTFRSDLLHSLLHLSYRYDGRISISISSNTLLW